MKKPNELSLTDNDKKLYTELKIKLDNEFEDEACQLFYNLMHNIDTIITPSINDEIRTSFFNGFIKFINASQILLVDIENTFKFNDVKKLDLSTLPSDVNCDKIKLVYIKNGNFISPLNIPHMPTFSRLLYIIHKCQDYGAIVFCETQSANKYIIQDILQTLKIDPVCIQTCNPTHVQSFELVVNSPPLKPALILSRDRGLRFSKETYVLDKVDTNNIFRNNQTVYSTFDFELYDINPQIVFFQNLPPSLNIINNYICSNSSLKNLVFNYDNGLELFDKDLNMTPHTAKMNSEQLVNFWKVVFVVYADFPRECKFSLILNSVSPKTSYKCNHCKNCVSENKEKHFKQINNVNDYIKFKSCSFHELLNTFTSYTFRDLVCYLGFLIFKDTISLQIKNNNYYFNYLS